MSNIEIKMNSVSVENLIDFYHENINAFNPPLDTQINSVKEYAQKLINNAVLFEAWVSNELAGLIAVYFNNYETKICFITSVIVSPNYQKQGIAKTLLERVVDYAKKKYFSKIKLEVHIENKYAISLYEKFDFKEIPRGRRDGGFILMEKECNVLSQK
jgi:GNAT superfamily N-acetyltransferase